MSICLTHATRERARFRHAALAGAAQKAKAMEILKECAGVLGVQPGHASLLVFTAPEADLAAIGKKLEAGMPELAQPAAAAPGAARPLSRRKLEVRCLLGAGLTTVGLAAIGCHGIHALAGSVFTLLASKHAWERRKAI